MSEKFSFTELERRDWVAEKGTRGEGRGKSFDIWQKDWTRGVTFGMARKVSKALWIAQESPKRQPKLGGKIVEASW